MDAILLKIGDILLGLLNEDLVYTALGAMVAIQATKIIISYRWGVPKAAVIWFLLSPVVTAPIAFLTWSYNDRVPWFVVALVASALANIAFTLILKNVLGRWAPDVYDQLNLPIDRRKNNNGPQDKERRIK